MQSEPEVFVDPEDLALAELPDPDPGLINSKALAAAIVAAVNDAHGPRKITNAEYLRTRSEHRHKPLLARVYYQNGIRLDREQLTSDAIEMLNLLQPGIYCDGIFQVVPMQEGAKMSALDIRYGNKSVDDRMRLKSLYATFEHMLAAMLKERAALVTQ